MEEELATQLDKGLIQLLQWASKELAKLAKE